MKQTFYFFFLILLSAPARSQKHFFNNTLPDSTTIANTRSLLNSLPADDYLKKEFVFEKDTLRYRLLVPEKTKKKTTYPLIITLHNSSRIGNDNEKQLEPMARLWLRKEIRDKYPAYVVAPQFVTRSSNYETDSSRGILVSKPSTDVLLLPFLVKHLENELGNIDFRRVYVVGYSMGGSTGQNLLSVLPGMFAALVSIAAVPDFSNLSGLNNKPVWLIHGQKDDENPYAGSVELFKEMKKNRKAVITTYTELDHNMITVPLLLSDEIPKWLFKQHK